MALYSVPTPDLLGGISQQPADVRFPNQVEAADNVYLSPIDGCTKRFSLEHKAKVMDGQADSSYIHLIDRSATETYAAIFSNRQLQIFDLEGNEYPIKADETGTAADFTYLDTTVGNGNQLTGAENMVPGGGGGWAQTLGMDFADTGPVAGTASPFTFGEAQLLDVKDSPGGAEAYIYQEDAEFVAAGGGSTHFSCYFRAGNFDKVQMGWEDDSGDPTARALMEFNLTTGTTTAIIQGVALEAEMQAVQAEDNGWYYCRVSLNTNALPSGGVFDTWRDGTGTRYFMIKVPYTTGGQNVYAFAAYGRDLGDPDAAYTKADVVRALTINDYTFITNGARTTKKSGATSATGYNTSTIGDEAHIYIREGRYQHDYVIEYRLSNDTETTKIVQRTWDGVNVQVVPVPGLNVVTTTIKTDVLAQQFVQGTRIQNSGTQYWDGNNFEPNPAGCFIEEPTLAFETGLDSEPDFVNVKATGSVIRIQTVPGVTFDLLRVNDSSGDRSMVLIKDATEFADDLPSICSNNTRIRISNASEEAEDDYWLRFIANDDNDMGAGYWQEDARPGQFNQFLASTMPHQLVRRRDDQEGTATGTPFQIYFTFEEVDWQERLVGEDDSNPFPTFLGRQIKSVFFWKGRLGFLSDENVILSEVNNYFNFFRTTVINLVDSDPIDVTASHSRVSRLHDSVAFQGNLILFSDQDQFILRGSPLTPASAAIDRITAYDNFRDIEVTATGRSVYFGYKRGSHSGVYELYQMGDTGLYRADDVTEHIPKLIEGQIESIEASSLEDVVAVKSSRYPADFQGFSDASIQADRSYLYIYKYAWSGNQKVQSSWVRWQFGDSTQIQSMKWLDNTLLLSVQRPDGLFFETITVQDRPTDEYSDVQIRLDRRMDETHPDITSRTYDPATGLTAIVLGIQLYDTDNLRVIRREIESYNWNAGEEYTITSVDTSTPNQTTIYVEGNVATENYFIGYVFPMYLEFSTPYLRERTIAGGLGTIVDGRFQLHYGRVSYERSAYFDVEVTPKDRDTDVNNFLFTKLEEDDFRLDKVWYPSGEFVFPIFARNTGLRIGVRSENQYPFTIRRAEWEATYESRARRWRV